MRLETLKVRNFRSCYETEVVLAPHLTLLVGENDAGKSNVVDAIRATLPPASGRGSFWFERDRDLSYGLVDGTEIEITRIYSDLTAGEDALFTPALVDRHRKLVHTTKYNTRTDLPRRQRVSHSVGGCRVPDPEPELRDRIVHVYLPPLRDAASALDSADGNRLADIFQVIASPDEIKAFEKVANTSLSKLAEEPTARKVVEGVQEHLTAVTEPVRHRIVAVRHREQRLRRLTRALRLHMAAEGLTPTDLLGSGLGYANLLYVATVVLELQRAAEFDLTVLLVEEPEAHLHPQLQSVLLAYLWDQAVDSAERHREDPTMPAGRIQIVATTHSPQLTSAVSIRDVVVLRCPDRVVEQKLTPSSPDGSTEQNSGVGEELAEDVTKRHTETVCVALGSVPMTDIERRKIDRYLDATRAALLFARQVILVEGIAEAMLLRVLAEKIIFAKCLDGESEAGVKNKQLREQFRAISIIAIDGIDFVPYLCLLLPRDIPLVERVVVVTDGDEGAGQKRKADIRAHFAARVESGCLAVHVGETTLEAELFAGIGNEELLRQAFLTQHPRSRGKWDALFSLCGPNPEERARVFSTALKEKTLELGKGDFAHVVAELIAKGRSADFKIPPYLSAAIRAATIDPVELAAGNEDIGPS